MKKKNPGTIASSRQVALWLAESSRDAWENVIAPWCERVLSDSWKRDLPAVIVVPTRGHANALKERLLRRGLSHLGLHFVTPTSLGEMLSREDSTPHSEPEHLRCFSPHRSDETPDDLTAKAVRALPVRSCARSIVWTMAGWEFEQLALYVVPPLVRRFRGLDEKCGFALPGKSIDSVCNSVKESTKFSGLLITGFDGAHWANWFLLRAAVELAENATVVLQEPHAIFPISISAGLVRGKKFAGKRNARQKRARAGAVIRFLAKRKCAA